MLIFPISVKIQSLFHIIHCLATPTFTHFSILVTSVNITWTIKISDLYSFSKICVVVT